MKILVILDMLKGFCRKGYPLSLSQDTSGIERYIASKAEETQREGGKVIFLCDDHTESDPEIGNPYPPHCMHKTVESEIIDELGSYIHGAIVLKKNTLSIFLDTGLDRLLKEYDPTEIEITGVCTDICVFFAVYEARIRGYDVFISQEGVLPLDPDKQSACFSYFKNRLGARIG